MKQDVPISLREFGIKPKHVLGQNFLFDDFVLHDTADLIQGTSGELVIEVGPGLGTLTKKILERGYTVFAIEKDDTFGTALALLKAKHEEHFDYTFQDFLDFHLDKWLEETHHFSTDVTASTNLRYHVCANIPYYITAPIIRTLLAFRHKPESITLLVQKEVGENLTATPGGLSVLAISAQLFAEVRYCFTVPAKSFYPKPKVDSAVIQLVPHKTPRYDIPDEKWFFKVVKACFLGKRKQIHNTLKNNMRFEEHIVAHALEQCGVSPAARPQDLSIDQWVKLADILKPLA